jgi:predicted ribosomally synthesized peptide with nif11-like leader
MSKESLDQFIQQISDSEELRARIGEEIDADSLIALGAEHGCEFTAEDLTAGAELSDEELDGVAGGIKQPETQGSGLTYNSRYGHDMYHFRCSIVLEQPPGMP